MGLLKKIFGSRNQRVVKSLTKIVRKINAQEAHFAKLSDAQLQAKTLEFRQRFQAGASLDSLLIEAFATVREASKRVLGMRHFDVQLIGGMVLHQGKIAEMRTGEGKTLSATLPVYLNAIPQKGVHVVTVNDYLAKRDAQWMRPVYEFLGLTVGVNLPNMSPEEKRAAYAADVTFGTNNEYGFDYLRDNMAFSLAEKVQRELFYAVVDEVDSILIDEARTPLIISGPSADSSDMYQKINVIIPQLIKRETENGEGDYYLDEKNRQAFLTEQGHQHIEDLLMKAGLLQEGESLYHPHNIAINHYVSASLRAHTLYQKNVQYIVKDDEVVIVDEHTGRTMPGRRWSEGLHQAIEAKEGARIQQENQTLASITFQNYFRLYKKLSGMTGTADTEAFEFQQIYGLEVVVIPTNRKTVRRDLADKVYLNQAGKYRALIEDIKACREKGQPVLVGTAAIETSEYLSDLLKKAGVPHQVLNAKYHEQEAKIIEEAGLPGTVTLATNMAGRGTDIVLGGNLEAEIALLNNPTEAEITTLKEDWKKRQEQVLKAGGLAVLGSERHESRRIDNQLRGRSGRQGDPGLSCFYLSLDDNLMRIFASDRVKGLMKRLGMKEDEAIEHAWVSGAIEKAQRKVEGFHFDIRKQLLEYDDVANEQRKVIYTQRNELLSTDDIGDEIKQLRAEVINNLVDTHLPVDTLEQQWDVGALQQQLLGEFGLVINVQEKVDQDRSLDQEAIKAWVLEQVEAVYQAKENLAGAAGMRQFEKAIMLQVLDTHWREHLGAMDHLRQGIHLRGYAQKNPKQEYKREAFNLFVSMLDDVKYEVAQLLSTVQIQTPDAAQQINEQGRQALPDQIRYQHQHVTDNAGDDIVKDKVEKVGRNELCPCGSGKRYKHCHGQL